MRTFPDRTAPRRAPLGRAAALGAAFALTAGAVAAPTLAEDLRHKQATIQSHEQQAQQDLDGSSAAYRNAQAKLAAARNKLHTAKWRVTHIQHALNAAKANDAAWQKRLAGAKARLATAQKQLDAAQKKTDAQRTVVLQNAISVSQRPNESAAQFGALLNSQSLSDIALQTEYQRIYDQVQASAYTDLTAAESDVSARHQQVAAATHEVSVGAGHASAQLAKVRKLQSDAVAARNAVTRLVRSSEAAAHQALEAARRDQAALDHLKAQEAAVIAKILAESGGTSRNGVSLSGMFLRPVDGPLTSPFGYREHPIYHYWGLHNGVDFAAPCGAREVAVETGRVAAEYYSDVWGNRLFLNLGTIDGHNYTVIYNHIARYAVGVGAIVARGQTVAYEGTTGWSTGCHIHFTVLRDGTPVNPMNYIG